MTSIRIDGLVDHMKERLAALTPPTEGENEYLASRRLRARARAFMGLCLEMADRHIKEISRFDAYAASVYEQNIEAQKQVAATLEAAKRLSQGQMSAVAATIANRGEQDFVAIARAAAIIGQAREEGLQRFSADHESQSARQYAALEELIELDDPERGNANSESSRAHYRDTRHFDCDRDLCLGTSRSGCRGRVWPLGRRASASKRFKKHPAVAQIDDEALNELDDFELAAANWCVATELLTERLRNLIDRKDDPPSLDEAKTYVFGRMSDL